jgi:methylenetetrahydrofolate reductase (NADPH)
MTESFAPHHVHHLFDGYALEITGKDIAEISEARTAIAPATPINIAFLGNESHEQRINAAGVILACGLLPVPIISSRRLKSKEDRDALLSGLVREADIDRVILVGGDPSAPAGPYSDSLDLIASNILDDFGIRHVGIVGYPEGHPKITDAALWDALARKVDLLRDAGRTVEITTQYGFDAEAVIAWIEKVRALGIDAPIRIGVPGPANVKRLLRFAVQFGVGTSAAIVHKYGFSLASLLSKVGPERFLAQLGKRLADDDLGVIRLHFYPFGGIAPTVEWIARQTEAHRSGVRA